MKNLTKLIVSMLLLFIFTKAFSQSDVAGIGGHVGIPGYYCGWDAATPIPFNLQHLANQNMNFRTNFALAPAGAGNRMIIRNGGFGGLGGRVAIGNNLPDGFLPTARLHLHLSLADTNIMRFTHFGTATTVTDGFTVGINANVTPNAELHQWENSTIDFFTNTPAGGHTRKMRIGHNAANTARVGIGIVNNPLTHLHLGLNRLVGSGWRPWMDIGTLMYGSPVVGSPNFGADNMYVGLRQQGNDSIDAVINWGNNPLFSSGANSFGDRLTFVFTAAAGNGQASTLIGLETARMTVNLVAPNTVRSFYGIGGDPATNLYSTGSADPQNTLEINSQLGSPTLPSPICGAGATGFSGLRLTDLTSASIPCPTNNLSLSVDGNGDVILVPGGTGTGFAGPCPGPLPVLPSDFGTNLNNFNFRYEGQGAMGTNAVLLGGNCAFAPILAKLHVEQTDPAPIFGANAQSGAIFGRNNDLSGASFQDVIGVAGASVVPDANWSSLRPKHYGGRFFAQGGDANYGVYATANFAGGQGSLWHAGHFEVTGAPSNQVGVYGLAPVLPGSYAGFFQGDVNVSGTITVGVYGPSDSMFKTNVDSITNASNIINQLLPKTFFFDTVGYSQFNFNNKRQYGLIAQDVEQVLPELVKTTRMLELRDTIGNIISPAVDYKTLNNNAFIAILIKSNQELQTRVTALENSSAKIGSTTLPSQTATLASGAILYQNAPNPFGDQTSIAYYLPEGVQQAQLVFFDTYGKEIKSVELVNKGDAKIDLTTSDLASGIYTYRLIADGQIIKTLQMVRAK